MGYPKRLLTVKNVLVVNNKKAGIKKNKNIGFFLCSINTHKQIALIIIQEIIIIVNITGPPQPHHHPQILVLEIEEL